MYDIVYMYVGILHDVNKSSRGINLHVYDITVSCTYSIMDIDTQEQAWF